MWRDAFLIVRQDRGGVSPACEGGYEEILARIEIEAIADAEIKIPAVTAAKAFLLSKRMIHEMIAPM